MLPRTDLELICGRVQLIADRDDVEEFAIGTTVDLARCRAALHADDVIPLDEPDTPEEAAEIEEVLLRRFANHAKCTNEDEAFEPDTSTLDDSSVLSVFVAVWWRDGAKGAFVSEKDVP
jgi:hypothetical protein